MQYIKINGRTFEAIKPRKNIPSIKAVQETWGMDLGNYYFNPSYEKQRAYDYWREWYCSTDEVEMFGVSSANTFSFSISALYVDEETREVLGVIKITPCHNRVYLF